MLSHWACAMWPYWQFPRRGSSPSWSGRIWDQRSVVWDLGVGSGEQVERRANSPRTSLGRTGRRRGSWPWSYFAAGGCSSNTPLEGSSSRRNGILTNPRVSPSGESIAFADTGTLKLWTEKANARTLASFPQGPGLTLAWTPHGNEVWFTRPGGGAAIWAASTRTGESRLVYQGVSQLALEDISQDGRRLGQRRRRRAGKSRSMPAGKSFEMRLSVYNSDLVAISDDARQVLFELGAGGHQSATDRRVPAPQTWSGKGTGPLCRREMGLGSTRRFRGHGATANRPQGAPNAGCGGHGG